ncbi:MAG: polymer-forming cytoskeletal protein [Deltaproteobacteria bacterium]|nr:polymer-forming cytoskeletal protein [Deltaproteobacteria bacterium]
MIKKNDEIKAFLGKGSEFSGKLVMDGAVRIDGEFTGEILGSGILTVGEGARVEGTVSLDTVIVYGSLKGTLKVKDRVELGATGRMEGNLKTAKLVVQEGASFNGEIKMGQDDSPIPEDDGKN